MEIRESEDFSNPTEDGPGNFFFPLVQTPRIWLLNMIFVFDLDFLDFVITDRELGFGFFEILVLLFFF